MVYTIIDLVYTIISYGIYHIQSWYIPYIIMVYNIIQLVAPVGTPYVIDILVHMTPITLFFIPLIHTILQTDI